MKHFPVCLALLAAPLFTSQSLAAKGGYFIPASALYTSDGALPGANSVLLGPSGTPKAQFSVLLPPDYKPDTPVKAKLKVTFGPANCKVKFSLINALRTRAGSPISTGTAGISPVGGFTIFEPIGNARDKTFTITGRKTGPVKGMKPGDMISITIARDAESADDDCPGGSLILFGVEVVYRKR